MAPTLQPLLPQVATNQYSLLFITTDAAWKPFVPGKVALGTRSDLHSLLPGTISFNLVKSRDADNGTLQPGDPFPSQPNCHCLLKLAGKYTPK